MLDGRPFFGPGLACEMYRRFRDSTHPLIADARVFVANLWREAEPYLDPDFLERAKEDFLARFWEMYLVGAMLRNGLGPRKRTRSKGPDVSLSQPACFVEAVVARTGTGLNAVPPMIADKAQDVPVEKIILRLTNAIDEKYRKYLRYIEKRTLTSSDPYIVAVNASDIGLAIAEPPIPFIVSAVLPFGNQFITINRYTAEVVGSGFEYRPEVKTASGSPVATTIFQDSSHLGISAVFYSRVDPVNRPLAMGTDFILVHNPSATNRIPHGSFPFGREYWVTESNLEKKDHGGSPLAREETNRGRGFKSHPSSHPTNR